MLLFFSGASAALFLAVGVLGLALTFPCCALRRWLRQRGFERIGTRADNRSAPLIGTRASTPKWRINAMGPDSRPSDEPLVGAAADAAEMREEMEEAMAQDDRAGLVCSTS